MLNQLVRLSFHFALVIFFAFAPAQIFAQTSTDWYMPGANPARTSSVPNEVAGDIQAVWYRPIEPYINYKTQVVTYNGLVYVATARGLYAFNADTGAAVWTYPTKVPLGHSPTVYNGNLYVGSHDRTIHCVNATTGQSCPNYHSHVALFGYETNPLLANNRIYAGNRDGNFYALDAASGTLLWSYKTGAAIRNSAAMDSQGIIYFASEDLHAYALKDNGASAQLIWKSPKLLGDTFASYWPVIYRDWVIFSGGMGYFYLPPWGDGIQLMWDDKDGINADLTLNTGKVAGDWVAGTVTMDASPILQYYEAKPHRRRVFMLARATGQEYTFDTDGDGKPEYAPFTFSGVTQSGSKYPPLVGNDGVLYTNVDIVAPSSIWTPLAALVGWKVGTKYISRVTDWGVKTANAADEPVSYSIGGRYAYWVQQYDIDSGSFNLNIPFDQPNRWVEYWQYGGASRKFPQYNTMYQNTNGWSVYGGTDGIYGQQSSQNPWVPYRNKLFRLMGNAIVAAAPGGTATSPLPRANIMTASTPVPVPTVNQLTQRLEEEVQKIIASGHLKPGLFKSNIGDFVLSGNNPDRHVYMDQGIYYFSNPADTILVLLRALPHLSSTTQTQLRAYIQNEMTNYPFDTYSYIGHQQGTSRQAAVVPPDYQSHFGAMAKQTSVYNNSPWRFPMMAFYTAWKYALAFPADTNRLYTNLKSKIVVPCPISNDQLIKNPQMMHAYLAGYKGFLELEKLAQQPVTNAVTTEYNRILSLLMANFSVNAPWDGYIEADWDYFRNFILARFFTYLTPEIAAQMRASILSQAQTVVNRIDYVAPYWFVAGYDATQGEGGQHQLYETSTFGARAWILQQPYSELVTYLDGPAFPIGDVFFLHNLISTLESPNLPPPSKPGDINGSGWVDFQDILHLFTNFSWLNIFTYNTIVNHFGS